MEPIKEFIKNISLKIISHFIALLARIDAFLYFCSNGALEQDIWYKICEMIEKALVPLGNGFKHILPFQALESFFKKPTIKVFIILIGIASIYLLRIVTLEMAMIEMLIYSVIIIIAMLLYTVPIIYAFINFFIHSLATFTMNCTFVGACTLGSYFILLKLEILQISKGEMPQEQITNVWRAICYSAPIIIMLTYLPSSFRIKGYMKSVDPKWANYEHNFSYWHCIIFISISVVISIYAALYTSTKFEGIENQNYIMDMMKAHFGVPFYGIAFGLHCMSLLTSNYQIKKAAKNSANQ